MMPPPDLRARILEAARHEAAPTRDVAERSATIAVVSGYAIAVVLMLVTGGPETTRRPPELLVATALGWASIALAAAWGAYGRGRSMLGRATSILGTLALVTGPLLLGWAMMTSAWPEAQLRQGTMRIHVACFAFTMMYALAPLVGLSIARRGTDPVHPRATGAALGAAAGAWGSVMIDLHCPLSGTMHVALAHVLPVVVLAALGAWAGRRIVGLPRLTNRTANRTANRTS